MENFAKRLNLNIDFSNKYWLDAYNKAILEPIVPYFINEEFVKKISDECGCLTTNCDILISAVSFIQKDENLCLLAKVLYHLLFLSTTKEQIFGDFNFQIQKKQNNLAYDLILVFPILAHLKLSYDILAKRGIEKSVLIDSLSQLDLSITECSEKEKRPCFSADFFVRYNSFIYITTFQIGRLRFEIAPKSYGNFFVIENERGEQRVLVNDIILHRSGNALGNLGFSDSCGSYKATIVENDEYIEGYLADKNTYLVNAQPTKFDKKEWKVVYRPTDDVVIVHIPPDGSLDRESVIKSYERARRIFKCCYPEYDFKAFVTDTWLFAPNLDLVLKENSNIRAFRKDYIIFPAKCLGLDVFTYVFNITPASITDVDVNNLPEDTSLRKGIKDCLNRGVFFDEFYGYYKF